MERICRDGGFEERFGKREGVGEREIAKRGDLIRDFDDLGGDFRWGDEVDGEESGKRKGDGGKRSNGEVF